ncbi:MAG: hypothetical protein HGA45_21640, partial [Chloroflexales bacterium]|nr:hypothetical protein [Chloroflexales bacterium]
AAVQLYGQTWLRRGWVLPGRDGKATENLRTHLGQQTRSLKVPLSAIENWADVTP